MALLLVLSAASTVLASNSALADGSGSASYSNIQTIPVPPASSYNGSGGGDGWALALTSTSAFNVFHHSSQLTVACHAQLDASPCWDPYTVTDTDGGSFGTSSHPGLWLDQSSQKLYVYATRNEDSSAGVVCIDTQAIAASGNGFCGFTLLSVAGDATTAAGLSAISAPALIGTHWYAFNSNPGSGVDGTKNTLLCFDTALLAACPSQPFTLPLPSGSISSGAYPTAAISAIGHEVIAPVEIDGADYLMCFDDATAAPCAGTWPVALATAYAAVNGPPFPLLDATGATTGFCLPTGRDECFSLTGSSTPTPDGMTDAITATSGWNGPGLTLGTRVYVPNGDVDQVQCYDTTSHATCPGFPRSFNDLELLYTVNADPQRPSCIWVNADSGPGQIQNFDAYTGGGCGQGAVRVLASSIVVQSATCTPTSYSSLQVVTPARGTYTTGQVTFVDGDDNPIPGVPDETLDATGSVSLTGLSLNTRTGLPQFLITLDGAAVTSSVSVKLTWTAKADSSCASSGQKARLVYVAVGDSYSSGEGAPPFEDGTNYPYVDAQDNTLTYGPGSTGCHRSLTNYAKIVAPRLSTTLTPLLIDRTCSGAEIAPAAGSKPPISPTNLTTGRTDGQVDQVRARLKAAGLYADDVQLVTATMGGNDAGFGDLIEACLIPTIAKTLFDNYDQTPGEVEWLAGRFHCQNVDDLLFHTGDKIKKLASLEEQAQAGLLDSFLNAQVLQLTYPGIVTDASSFAGDSCGGLMAADAPYVRSKVNDIDNAIRSAAAATANSRLHIVDVQGAFGSNALCPADPSKALANGVDQTRLTTLIQSLLKQGTPTRALLDELDSRYKGFRSCVISHFVVGGLLGDALCKGPAQNLDTAFNNVKDYFTKTPGEISTLVGDLAPGATAEARFDNSRLFFHPNRTGYDVMACHVEAAYNSTSAAGCTPQFNSVLTYSVNGVALVHVAPTPVKAGSLLKFNFNGFDAGTAVHVLIHSQATDLGGVPVAAGGDASGSVRLPTTLGPGVHKLTFSGTNNSSGRQIDVLVRVPGEPVAGQDYGVYQSGFGSDSSVDVKLGSLDLGSVSPDADGGVYVEVPLPQFARGQAVPLTLTGDDTAHSVKMPLKAMTTVCSAAPVAVLGTHSVTAGNKVTIAATLRMKGTADLFAKASTSKVFKLVKSSRTSAKAKVTFSFASKTNTQFYVRAHACPETYPSRQLTLQVRTKVTLAVHRSTARTYTFNGVLSSSKAVSRVVTVYRVGVKGRLTLLGRARAGRSGHWSLPYTFTGPAAVVVEARTPRTTTNAAGVSSMVRVSVR